MKMNANRNAKAVALIYEEKSAPFVAAKGDDELAARIIEKAREHNIPIQEDAAVVEALSELALGEEIPEELYLAVAEILAFAYALQQKYPGSC